MKREEKRVGRERWNTVSKVLINYSFTNSKVPVLPPSILSSATKLSTTLLRAEGGGWIHCSVTEKGPVSVTVRLLGGAGSSIVWVQVIIHINQHSCAILIG